MYAWYIFLVAQTASKYETLLLEYSAKIPVDANRKKLIAA